MRSLYVFLRDGFYHRAISFAGALWYWFPSRHLTVIGVTGTKGKSTTVELIAHILDSTGRQCVVSSTVRNENGGMTMPGRFFIQRLLARGVRAGARYAVLEVTSQGVLQHRHRFIDWDVCVFTNLAPEHVEAHGGFENYRAAKVSFFSYAAARNPNTRFVVNADDANTPYFVRAVGERKIFYFSREESPATLPGAFNEYNVGAAVAACIAAGVPEAEARAAAKNFSGIRGRMEYIQREPFGVVVDYAVTPDSLTAAYRAARAVYGRGKMIGVFGCTGGGRDTWKRAPMGKIAGEACDMVVLTDDDSYDEDTADIMAAIEAGVRAARPTWREGEDYWKVADRKAAIAKALSLAQPNDVVVITGKGGDRWLRMAKARKIPWCDQDVIKGILYR